MDPCAASRRRLRSCSWSSWEGIASSSCEARDQRVRCRADPRHRRSRSRHRPGRLDDAGREKDRFGDCLLLARHARGSLKIPLHRAKAARIKLDTKSVLPNAETGQPGPLMEICRRPSLVNGCSIARSAASGNGCSLRDRVTLTRKGEIVRGLLRREPRQRSHPDSRKSRAGGANYEPSPIRLHADGQGKIERVELGEHELATSVPDFVAEGTESGFESRMTLIRPSLMPGVFVVKIASHGANVLRHLVRIAAPP